jgi:hypothetical protein
MQPESLKTISDLTNEYKGGDSEPADSIPKKPKGFDWSQTWENLIRIGLGETAIRLGTGFVLILLVFLILWIMGNFYLKGEVLSANESVIAAPLPTGTGTPMMPEFVLAADRMTHSGILRLAMIHTNLPTHARFEITQYLIQQGDTVFGIAEKFNLQPQTILWGNYDTLYDDPERIVPGQVLNILPVDGVYYEWHAGDGLNGVASFFGVTPEAIIAFEGNNLTLETVGDFANPNIAPGTKLIIPGGQREFITWSAPRITRENPGVAKIYGAGYCGEIMDGPVGNGTFIWPTTQTFLSGYDYSPETNHFGIDIAGQQGNAIYGVDNGVVVYAGWNDHGYGQVIVIDHGNGWQSLYAHLSALNVICGSYVYQGDVIGAMGTTGNSSGPHLHFELRSDVYGKVNPWDFLAH